MITTCWSVRLCDPCSMGGGSDSTKATYFKKMKGECEFGYLSHNNGDNVVYCHYEKKVV